MLYFSVCAGLVFALFSVGAKACTYLDESSFLVLSKEEQEAHLASCNIDGEVVIAGATEVVDGAPEVNREPSVKHAQQVDWTIEQDTSGTFWDDWAKDLDSPVLSSNSDSSFYGLGVWLPKRYSTLDIDDTMELIKKYGLQMSFGFGGEDNDSPRVRFDYRWHDENELDDIFIQVEFPFQ